MLEVRLFDTLSREVRPLRAEDGKRLRMYVCGPTVYGPAHIGNFLTFVRFDVVYRLARAAGLSPYYVRNITDVDDKTIAGAQTSGRPLADFTRHWTERFHADCAALNLLVPDVEPKATEHLAEQIAMVGQLIERGHAYVAGDGSVYYRVSSFADYGKLSHFDPEALRSQATNSAGRTNQADEYDRETVADFALWKARKPEDGDNAWESPWGPGRPGWHLECSAMSRRYLGDGFDLHGGGEDLCFPHHENEIAQSEAATGQLFCRHWMHGVHLLVEGKKMSKSLGNFFTVEDLLARGHTPMAIRLLMLGGHYRQQLNFTLAGLSAAASGLAKLEKGVRRWLEAAGVGANEWASLPADVLAPTKPLFPAVWAGLADDLNLPAALGALHQGLRQAPSERAVAVAGVAELKLLLEGVLGLKLALTEAEDAERPEAPAGVAALAAERWAAKQARDWARADALRAEISAAGWQVLDHKDGYTLEPQ
jgi:cysteinyl-tRNA synthetase